MPRFRAVNPAPDALRLRGSLRVPAALVLFVLGCRGDWEEDCYCEGEELDFAVVGNLAGHWEAPGNARMDFDADHRLRNWSGIPFGCAPNQAPLVVGSRTAVGGAITSTLSTELVFGETHPGGFELLYLLEGGLHRHLRVDLTAETEFTAWWRIILHPEVPFVVDENTLSKPYTKISDVPAPTPETPPCK